MKLQEVITELHQPKKRKASFLIRLFQRDNLKEKQQDNSEQE